MSYLLQHGSALSNLRGDVLVKDDLREDEDGAVLGLDAELLGLDVDVEGLDAIDATLLLSLGKDPIAEFIVDSATGTLAIFILVVTDAELLLEITGELRLAGTDGLLAHVDGPVIVLDLDLGIDLGGLSLHPLELVVAAGVSILSGIVGAVLGAVLAAALAVLLAVAVLLLGLAGGLALGLVLLALLGLVLEDEAAELEAEVHVCALAAGLAVEDDVAVLDDDVGLGVLALLAEDELVDEAVEVVLELGGVVRAVDDPAVVLGVHVGLGAELKAEVLDDVGAGTSERLSDARQVDNYSLDSISFALNLGLQPLHLVAIEGIAHIATNVDKSHGGGYWGSSWQI